MVSTESCIIFQEGSNNKNVKKFRNPNSRNSRSNDNSRKSSKHHIQDMGPLYKSQFKKFKDEEDEFTTTLRKAESLNLNDCTWLSSSGASSPSSCLLDNTLSHYTDLKIDAWLLSLLSTPSTKSHELLSTKATFFDGSVANPIEEASLVLDQKKDFLFQENLEEEQVVSWLANSIENESSSVSSITDSSDEYEYSFSSCCSSDYSSEVVDLEEIGTSKPLFWPSEWTSEWDSDIKQDFLIMSPRKDTYKMDLDKGCKKRLVFGTQSNSSTNLDLKKANGINKTSKIVPLDNEADSRGLTEDKVDKREFMDNGSEETRTIKPVFWPYDWDSEWYTDTKWDSDTKWDLFVMSPVKDVCHFSKTPKSSPDSIVSSNVMEGGITRSKSLEIENMKTETIAHEEVKPLTVKSVTKNRIVLEDLLLVDKLNVDGAIEEVLGLDEFDGREGLGSEFDKEEFSLVEIF